MTTTNPPFHTERLRPTRPPIPASPQAGSQAPARRYAAASAVVLPGLLAAAGIGLVATVIGRVTPLVGSAVPGALLGAAVAVALHNRTGLRARLAPGLALASTRLLQCSVVILGAQLSLARRPGSGWPPCR
jgi:uncharacterized membrane protein YadS